MRSTVTSILILVVLSIPLSLIDLAHFPYDDGPEHGAAVRELAKNLIHPADPMLTNHAGNSPRFVPSTLIMALFMRLLHLDVLVVLKIFLAVYFFLFLVAIALFSREYFNDAGQAPWSLVTLLFLWGMGWTGANAYMFSAMLYTAYFPAVVSFSLSLMALYTQLCFIHRKKTLWLILTILLGSLAFINHPLTGVFFFICSGLLSIEKGISVRRMMYAYAVSGAAALSLMALWPYYDLPTNILKIISGKMQQAADYQITRHYLYSKVVLRAGPALAGIPLLILLLVWKRHLLLVGGFVAFGLIYLTGYLCNISLAERFIFFIIFTLQMTVSRMCRKWFSFSPPSLTRGIKSIIAWLLILFLASGVIIQMILICSEFIFPAFKVTPGDNFPHYVNPNKTQTEMKKYLREGDVVLSDIYSSWSIPVYTGAKIIALFHTPPHVDDNLERIRAVETFYDTSTTCEERRAILKRYGVTHILLNFQITGKDIEPTVQEMGFPVSARGESFCLFSVSSRNSKVHNKR